LQTAYGGDKNSLAAYLVYNQLMLESKVKTKKDTPHILFAGTSNLWAPPRGAPTKENTITIDAPIIFKTLFKYLNPSLIFTAQKKEQKT